MGCCERKVLANLDGDLCVFYGDYTGRMGQPGGEISGNPRVVVWDLDAGKNIFRKYLERYYAKSRGSDDRDNNPDTFPESGFNTAGDLVRADADCIGSLGVTEKYDPCAGAPVDRFGNREFYPAGQ